MKELDELLTEKEKSIISIALLGEYIRTEEKLLCALRSEDTENVKRNKWRSEELWELYKLFSEC